MIFSGAYFVGGAAGAYYGGTTYTSIFISVGAGAVTGGVIGQIVFPVLGVGNSDAGWRFGETVGAFAGLAGNFDSNSSEFLKGLFNRPESEVTEYGDFLAKFNVSAVGTLQDIGFFFYGPAMGWAVQTVGVGVFRKKNANE